MTPSGPVFVGVDAGGTTTRSVLLDEQLTVLARGTAGPANHRTASRESVMRSVHQAIRAVVQGRRAVTAVGIGWSGLEAPGSEAEARQLVADAVTADHHVLDSDVYAAHVGAFAGGPGLLVSAGTGSMALAVDGEGHRVRAGGWGYLYGDEGSATWIAREAIRAALKSVDGRGAAFELWSALLQHIGAAEQKPLVELALEVTAWLYSPERHVSEVAAFARTVHTLAAAGDGESRSILVRAGEGLAELALACAARTPSLRTVVGSGSVWRNNEIVRHSCRSRLEGSGLDLRFAEPKLEPEVGAALMGRRAAVG